MYESLRSPNSGTAVSWLSSTHLNPKNLDFPACFVASLWQRNGSLTPTRRPALSYHLTIALSRLQLRNRKHQHRLAVCEENADRGAIAQTSKAGSVRWYPASQAVLTCAHRKPPSRPPLTSVEDASHLWLLKLTFHSFTFQTQSLTRVASGCRKEEHSSWAVPVLGDSPAGQHWPGPWHHPLVPGPAAWLSPGAG